MLQTSLQCSLLLVPDSTIFPRANALKANYLFHGQSHDLGDGTLGCGRRSDAIKLFLGWKYYGKLGYQARIEKSLSNVRRFVELLHQDDMRGQQIQMLRLGSDDHDLEERLVKERQHTRDKTQPSLLQICFWYRPKGSKKIDWRGTERLWKRSVDSLTVAEALPQKKKAILLKGDMDSAAVTPVLNGGAGSPQFTSQPTLESATPISEATHSRSSSAESLTSFASLGSSATLLSTSGSEAPTTSGRIDTTTKNMAGSDHGIILENPQDRKEAKAWMESVTKAIHGRIRVRGGFMIDYAPLGSYLPVFFRVVLNPPTIRELDLVKLVEEILECGHDVADALPIPECCRA